MHARVHTPEDPRDVLSAPSLLWGRCRVRMQSAARSLHRATQALRGALIRSQQACAVGQRAQASAGCTQPNELSNTTCLAKGTASAMRMRQVRLWAVPAFVNRRALL